MFDPMNDPLNILYIEDKLADFKLVERHLVKHGPAMVCTRVSNPGELLAALASQSWDLVLSDYNLPLLPFDETLRLLRPALENLPVIFALGQLGRGAGGGVAQARGLGLCPEGQPHPAGALHPAQSPRRRRPGGAPAGGSGLARVRKKTPPVVLKVPATPF
jgi:CheY-like chemotaxis protein